MAEQSVSVPYAGGDFTDQLWNVSFVRLNDDLHLGIRFQNDPDFALVEVFNYNGSGNSSTSNPTVQTLKNKIYPFAIPYQGTAQEDGHNNHERNVRLCRFNDTTALMLLGDTHLNLRFHYLVKVDPSTYEVTFDIVNYTHGKYRYSNNMVEGEKNLGLPGDTVTNNSYFYQSTLINNGYNYWSQYVGKSMKNVEDNVIIHYNRYSNDGMHILDLRLNPATDVVTANCIAGYGGQGNGADASSEIKFKRNYVNGDGYDFGAHPQNMMGTSNDSSYAMVAHEATDKDDNIWITWTTRSNAMPSSPQFASMGNDVNSIPCMKYVKGQNVTTDPSTSVDSAWDLYLRTNDNSGNSNYDQFYQNYTDTQDFSAAFGSWLPINGTTKFIEAGLNKFRVHGDPNSAGVLPYLRITNDNALSNTNYTGIIMQSMWLDDDHFALCYGNGTGSGQTGASGQSSDARVNIYKYVDENLIYFVQQLTRPGALSVYNYNAEMHPFVKLDDYTLRYDAARGTWYFRAPE